MVRCIDSLCGLSVSIALVCSAGAETSIVPAAADATLIESSTGALGNGAGPAFFVGRNSQASEFRRRGLIRFDVAAALPAGVIVTRAELRLVLTPSNLPPIEIGLHRVLADWGEGASISSGGAGADAAPGDATWLHTFFDEELWAEPGGDFAAEDSAALEVGDAGVFVWPSTPATVADAQAWLEVPEQNHGWLLLSAEDVPTSAKRFASREEADATLQPQLLIEYVYPCDTLLLEADARALCSAYCEALDCDASAQIVSPRACEQIARRFAQATGGVTLPCPPTERESSGGLPQTEP
jgi:hypothetical protein